MLKLKDLVPFDYHGTDHVEMIDNIGSYCVRCDSLDFRRVPATYVAVDINGNKISLCMIHAMEEIDAVSSPKHDIR